MKKRFVPSHVSVGWRDGEREQGYCHAEVADGQINHKKLGRLQGGLLPESHEEKGSIPQHRQHTWEAEVSTFREKKKTLERRREQKEGVTVHLRWRTVFPWWCRCLLICWTQAESFQRHFPSESKQNTRTGEMFDLECSHLQTQFGERPRCEPLQQTS